MFKRTFILALGIILSMGVYLYYNFGIVFLTNENDIKLSANEYNGIDVVLNDLKEGTKEAANNTRKLQDAINKVSDSGGGTVYLPAGTYYFGRGGYTTSDEDFAIKCRNNVHIKGKGTDENSSSYTVLKPLYDDPKALGGMDMFYFNNYKDTGFGANSVTMSTRRNVSHYDVNGNEIIWENQTVYLINADFSDFVIDGDSSRGGIKSAGGAYRTDGKGFMINLFADCDWNNVVVKNVDATGFGVDCPINSTIKNCKAINCGKAALKTDGGASGFGIGTGFSNEESLVIENSVAINNKKFGFFFEHQARFSNGNYNATTSKGFVVANSVAGGNMYDFGGLKSYDVTYENNKSVSNQSSYFVEGLKNTNTKGGRYNYTELKFKGSNVVLNKNTQPLYFSAYSTNSFSINTDVFHMLTDVKEYKEEVKWAVNNGILPVSSVTSFEPNEKVTRFEVIKSLYEFSGRDANVEPTKDDIANYKSRIKKIGFNDLSTGFEYDLDAVLWAYNNGIISKTDKFRPNDNCTRAELVTMLYRMAGSPSVNGIINFNDVLAGSWYYDAVLWAYNNNITKGTYANTFAPSESLSKVQLALFLYRYKTTISSQTYKIKINVIGGTHSNNDNYNINTNYVLKNPVREGFTFLGWTGSNGTVASKNVTIKSGTTGNLSYTANWEPDLEEIIIKKMPKLNTYKVGDKLNTDGLVVVARYGDNNIKEINNYNVETKVLNTLGMHQVNVYYLDKVTSFEVNVIETETNKISKISKIIISEKPNKTEYYVGEECDYDGLKIKVINEDGSSYIISEGFTIESKAFNDVGVHKVNVSYLGKTTSFEVNVIEIDINEISKISILEEPNKTKYYVGEKVNLDGLKIKVINEDGSSYVISEGFTTNSKILNKVGVTDITVEYMNKTTTFDVEVVNKSEKKVGIFKKTINFIKNIFRSFWR